jgi:hypothetical protein
MSPSSIAETYFLCSFLAEFGQQHGLPITLVIPHGHQIVVELFEMNIKRVIHCDVMTMRRLSDYSGVPQGSFQPDVPINTWVGAEGDSGPSRLYRLWIASKGTKGLDFANIYRFKLRLDWSSAMARPRVLPRLLEKGRAIVSGLNVQGRFAMVHTGNNTNAPISDPMIESIFRALHRQGYSAIVNDGGASFACKRFDLDFLRYVQLGLEDAIAVSLCADKIIGGSNGLTNLLSGIPHGKSLHVLPPSMMLDGHGSTVSGVFFRPVINPFEGSMFLCCAESISEENDYCEWFVPDPCDPDTQESIADAIATDQRLPDFCMSNRS